VSASKVCPVCNADYAPDTRFCPVDASPLRVIVDSTDLSGRMIASRYELLSKIGEGGMGEVYLAEQITISRRCAIKVMKPALVDDRDAISRFAREASNASRINHTNVAAVYDFGESDGLLFLVMEYVPGQPLSSLLRTKEPLAVGRVLGIGLQIAEALAVAHDAGVIHRDLKPDNIMLCPTAHGGELAKVVDFGIAKGTSGHGQTITGTGFVVGTPGYMSPEQLVGDPIDSRSDLYSLACVMYKALVGESPFGTTAEEQIARRLIEPPPSARSKNPLVPAAIDAVILHTLQRDPAQRYQNAREFRAALVAAWAASTTTSSDIPAALWPPLAFSATEILGHRSAERPETMRPVETGTRPPIQPRGRTSSGAVAACATVLVLGAATWVSVSAMQRRSPETAAKASSRASPTAETSTPPTIETPPFDVKRAGSSSSAISAGKDQPVSSGLVNHRPVSLPKAASVATKIPSQPIEDSLGDAAQIATTNGTSPDAARVRDSLVRLQRGDSIRLAPVVDAARRADTATSTTAAAEAARLARMKEEEIARSTPPVTELSAYLQSFMDAVNHGDPGTIRAAAPLVKTRDDFTTIVRQRHPTAAIAAVENVVLDGSSARKDFTMAISYRGNFGTTQTATAWFRASMTFRPSAKWARDGIVLLRLAK
jgi:serine/threonine-protein kinase